MLVVETLFGLVAVMPLRHVHDGLPPPARVSSREASKRGGLMMVARRVWYVGAPAVGYGVRSLPMCVKEERIFVAGGSCV
jgi:hypothetical protein